MRQGDAWCWARGAEEQRERCEEDSHNASHAAIAGVDPSLGANSANHEGEQITQCQEVRQ